MSEEKGKEPEKPDYQQIVHILCDMVSRSKGRDFRFGIKPNELIEEIREILSGE